MLFPGIFNFTVGILSAAFSRQKKGSVSPFDLTVSGIREPYSETLKSHQHLTQLKNALLLIYESHLTSESNLERLISKILSQPVPYPSSGIPTNILILPSLDYVIKWGASTWWSSSLCCSMPKSDEMTIGKAHPTLFNFIPT